MFNNNFITGIILAGTIAITGTSSAYAVKNNEKPQNTPDISRPVRIHPGHLPERIKSALDGLVKEGKITQAQEEAVIKAFEAKKAKAAPGEKGNKPDGQRKSHMSELVSAGTITQAQAEAIRDAFRSAKGSDKTKREILDSLVKAGTITKDQEDAIVKAIPHRDGKGGHHGWKRGVLNDLVKAGTITQPQADAIMEAIKASHGDKNKPEGKEKS